MAVMVKFGYPFRYLLYFIIIYNVLFIRVILLNVMSQS